MKVKAKIFFLGIFLFLLTINVHAFSINIDPPSIYTKAKPGQATSAKITVENTSKEPINVKIYAQDWEYANDLSKNFLNLGESPYSLNTNLKIYVKDLFLSAKEKKDVIFNITSPQDKNGGLYGVIFFEATPVLFNKSAKVKLIGRIGTIIYHTIDGTEQNNFDISIDKYIKKDDKNYLLCDLVNKGNVHVNLQGSVLILNSSKKVLKRINLTDIKALPNSKQSFLIDVNEIRETMNKTAIFTLQYGEDKIFSKELKI